MSKSEDKVARVTAVQRAVQRAKDALAESKAELGTAMQALEGEGVSSTKGVKPALAAINKKRIGLDGRLGALLDSEEGVYEF